jgi:hypothetical protein
MALSQIRAWALPGPGKFKITGLVTQAGKTLANDVETRECDDQMIAMSDMLARHLRTLKRDKSLGVINYDYTSVKTG